MVSSIEPDLPNATETRATDIESQHRVKKKSTGFLDLPAELRNRVYDLSRCIEVHQCRRCSASVFGDSESLTFNSPSRTVGPHAKYYGPKDSRRYKTTAWPILQRPCALYETFSTLAPHSVHRKGLTTTCGPAHRSSILWINKGSDVRLHHSHSRINIDTPSPAQATPITLQIAQVCKPLRPEVLSIYYSSNRFFGTIFDIATDSAAILKWFEAIGPVNARHLQRFEILYHKKKVLQHIKGFLKKRVEDAGLRVAEGVLEIKKMKIDFCSCDTCVHQSLRDRAKDAPRGNEIT